MAALTGLFLVVGFLDWRRPRHGASPFLFAAGTNLFAYWNSDKVLLSHVWRTAGRRECSARSRPYRAASWRTRPACRCRKSSSSDNEQPNAFATGRNPEHAAVCVTTGLLQRVNQEELAGVLAHELGHVKHRDTLTMTITATIAGAVSMLANFAFFLGGGRRNPLGLIGAVLLVRCWRRLPRCWCRWRSAARASSKPTARAPRSPAGRSGLPPRCSRSSSAARSSTIPQADANPATAHMFIINPLHGGLSQGCFASHPSTAERIARLRAMAGSVETTTRIGPWA